MLLLDILCQISQALCSAFCGSVLTSEPSRSFGIICKNVSLLLIEERRCIREFLIQFEKLLSTETDFLSDDNFKIMQINGFFLLLEIKNVISEYCGMGVYIAVLNEWLNIIA